MVKTAKKTGSSSSGPAPKLPKLGVGSTNHAKKGKTKAKAKSKPKPKMPKGAVSIPRPGGKTKYGLPFVKKGESQDWYKNFKLAGYIPELAIDENKLMKRFRNIRDSVHTMKWGSVFESPGDANLDLVMELYANWDLEQPEDLVKVRGQSVRLDASALCTFLGVEDHDLDELKDFIRKPDYKALRQTLCGDDVSHRWGRKKTGRHKSMQFCKFQKEARIWLRLINARLFPSDHFTNVTKMKACLVYFFMTGKPVNIGYYMLKAMKETRTNKSKRLSFAGVLTQFLVKKGVPVDTIGDRIVPAMQRKFDISSVQGPSANTYKLSNDERRDMQDNMEGRKYLMLEYLAKHAGMDMAALDRQLPLLESSKRLLGMTQTVEVPPGEDDNTDSDVIDADSSSDGGEWTEEEDGEEEEEEEDARTPPHRLGGSVRGTTVVPTDDDADDET